MGLAPVLLLGLVGPLDVGDSAERRLDDRVRWARRTWRQVTPVVGVVGGV
jgi:hypothetical protein